MTISVCLPAVNEQATIGTVLRPLRSELKEGLIHQLVVVDQSTDRTPEIAGAMGAEVYTQSDLMAHLGPVVGKGDAMYRSLSVLRGDVIVWLDADSEGIGQDWVARLSEPIIHGEADYVKAHYRRPLGADKDGGGRLNHLFGAPLMRAFWPEIGWIRQPLAGETAITRGLAETVPFELGMAIEPALTIDAYRYGGRLAQVDLGVHRHRHHPLRKLAARTDEALAAVLDRAGVEHGLQVPPKRAALRTALVMP